LDCIAEALSFGKGQQSMWTPILKSMCNTFGIPKHCYSYAYDFERQDTPTKIV
jgi:hypothetical protein